MKWLLFGMILTPFVLAELPPDHAEKMGRGLELFRAEVAPLLQEHCIKCHGGEKVKGDFDMATREGLLRGGSEGVAVVLFDSGKSHLMKLVHHEEEPYMPERKPKLPDEALQKIALWIDLGAPYDAPLVAGKAPPKDRSVVTAEDRQWWAFQPLAAVAVPSGAPHPIDAFLLEQARSKNLALNPRADPRTLIRRATLGLTGLPPTVAEVEEFVKNPEAGYDALVSRLLDSPAYGERWARHWLDVARFAESSGFEHDYDRPHAYHYRDFVIRALNEDMPFTQFARWQLAGDEFEPGNAYAMMATGFLGAGVFPTQITENEVERTRYDAMDDMLATTGSAFLGLTLGCARCHDHKFDPIPERDYYQMLATFTTTVRSNIDLEVDPSAKAEEKAVHAKKREELAGQLAHLETTTLRARFDEWLGNNPRLATNSWTLLEIESLASQAGATFRKLDDASWLAEGANGGADTYTFVGTTALRGVTGLKLDALTHASAPHNGPGRATNGNFALSRITVKAEPLTGGPAKEVALLNPVATHQQNKDSLSVASSLDNDASSGWAVDFGGIGKDQAAAFAFAEPLDFEGGAKLTVTLQFAVNTGHNLVRSRLSVSHGAPPELQAEALPPEIVALSSRLTKLSAEESRQLFDWWKARQPEWREGQARLTEHDAKVPASTVPVMVCAEGHKPIVMHSQGPPFLNETHILKRGDPNQKQEVATQGFLQVLSKRADASRWQWTPPAGAAYSGRRRTFANWLTDVEKGGGALMARVTVNRLWQHHFGRGLVASPNDFGKTGALPSHPALLDWLAGELIRHEWKLKPIHRLIMSSEAYRQSSGVDAAKAAADPDNTLFLRFMPRRLESEAVRDSLLAVSGLLDRTMFGPGTLDENSKRRSIYFTVKRSRLMNSMVVFDAPEPLTSQGDRPTTTVAPQALLLMNSPQARQWAESFAKLLQTDHATGDAGVWVQQAYLRALARAPTPEETTASVAFIEAGLAQYTESKQANPALLALADFCQTLLALNEFVYVN